MKKIWSRLSVVLSASLLAGQVAVVAPAQARDDVVMISISDALATPDARDKLDGSVRFYFGSAAHPGIAHKFGDLVTNEKTNSLGKPALRACEWVFLSDLLKFQERAKQLGANAVVNIDSYYKRDDAPSATQVECHSGFFVTGVALRGDFVKLSGN